MDRLRRTFSFRRPKKKSEPTESSKPQQWLDDESKIKEGCCSFQVKYLGNIEVYESRGMQVCEEAIKALRKSKKKPQKAILYVSGDALRVSDDVSQHLIVDQTIEKVSFCAPDRSHEKGFAYICRDGATRRWMCYAFMSIKDSGERLSHAVGCAFAICLEKKQKREQDAFKLSCGNASDDRGFARTGSGRPQLPSVSQRLIDPQSALVPKAPPNPPVSSTSIPSASAAGTGVNGLSGLSAPSTSAGTIARPRPSASVFERQASLRMFPKLQDASPFKRDLSLRLESLPSSLQSGIGAACGDTAIPEEPSTEVADQEPTLLLPTSTTATMISNSSAGVPRPPSCEQVAAIATAPVANHSTSLESELSALTFPDPFSSAPVNPATIQQHLQQQQQQQQQQQKQTLSGQLALPGRNHLAAPPGTNLLMPVMDSQAVPQGYGGVAGFSAARLPVGPPAPAVPSTSSPLAASLPCSAVAGSTVPLGGCPDLASYPAATASPVRPVGPPTSSLALPAGQTVSAGMSFGYPPASPAIAARQPTWSSTQTPDPNSAPWRSAVPLLLPPEPDRYSDPFDLGWAERATAVLNQSMRKPGNPFADRQSPSVMPAVDSLPFAAGETGQSPVSVPANGYLL